MASVGSTHRSYTQMIISLVMMIIGAFLAALAIKVFLLPNMLIDGGVVGLAMMASKLFFDDKLFGPIFVIITIPFIILSYFYIRKTFFILMLIASAFFLGFNGVVSFFPPFIGDPLEIIVLGGAILGIGGGFIIRSGACLDGTEILAIIINRKTGFTVGQVVLVINVFVFSAYGYLSHDWHVAVRSLLTYVVAFKMMDLVIVGLDELKSVMIITNKPKKVTEVITHKMGLGLTIMYGRGGYSGDAREILFVIVERLDLAELKEIILYEDPSAFITVQNLHEVVYGSTPRHIKKMREKKASSMWKSNPDSTT